MKIAMIGSGNVATRLSLALRNAGHEFVAVWSRQEENAHSLASRLSSISVRDIALLPEADVYLISVKDDAISEIARQLCPGDGIVVHTSGTVGLSELAISGGQRGIFYPLQTMKKDITVSLASVPFILEASDLQTLEILTKLAESISSRVYVLDEIQRQWLHVAAVFANNFTNHLYALSEGILQDHGIARDLLQPLILQSVQNIMDSPAALLQTGPAARGDYKTIEKHLMLLADQQRLQSIYRILTDSILQSALPKKD